MRTTLFPLRPCRSHGIPKHELGHIRFFSFFPMNNHDDHHTVSLPHIAFRFLVLRRCFARSNMRFPLALPKRPDHSPVATICWSGHPYPSTSDNSQRSFRRRRTPVTLAVRRGLSDLECRIRSHAIVLVRNRYVLAPSAHRSHACMVGRSKYCTEPANVIPDHRGFCREYAHATFKHPELLT